MIKKLIFIVTVCLFAAGTIINMHLAQNDHNTDISLADISVMAQADGEQFEEEIWIVTKKCHDPVPTITCMNGGSETCILRDHCDVG